MVADNRGFRADGSVRDRLRKGLENLNVGCIALPSPRPLSLSSAYGELQRIAHFLLSFHDACFMELPADFRDANLCKHLILSSCGLRREPMLISFFLD